MPIPEEILAVTRPVNSVVVAYGKDKNRFSVRQRTGCKYIDGRRIPVTGATIGHIVDGVYVPIDKNEPPKLRSLPVDVKDWADITLCDREFLYIKAELLAVYDHETVIKIYCIAILRVCNKGIKDCELKEAYEDSFLSELYPNVALSRNTVSTLLNDLGKRYSRIVLFMRNRTAAVAIDHHLLVDGTLKSDESKVNSLSDFSRKALKKGTKDISVLYAFDLENMEPVCSKCFPGNFPDASSYRDFIVENQITKGIIVADKGFPAKAVIDVFDDKPDLHYLNPIKRNSSVIYTYRLRDYEGTLPGFDGITYKKAKAKDTEKWYYSFRDSEMASDEEFGWLKKANKKSSFDSDKFKDKQQEFGTIVLESDLDLPPATIYRAYSARWEIETVMRYYKTACGFDETRVQDDYSVYGSEFVDFLSCLLTFRLIHAFDKSNLLEKYTYKKLMSVLKRSKKVRLDGEWIPTSRLVYESEILQELELIPKPKSEAPQAAEGKPKRGRPKKTEAN